MEESKRSLQNFIFSDEFMEGIDKAIKEAVDKAEASGLPPAYEPAFSKLKEFRSEQKKSREELVELRRNPGAENTDRDQATIEFHHKVFELLEEGGQPAGFIMRKAREITEMWEHRGLNNVYGPMWKQLLEETPTTARDFVLSNSPDRSSLGLRVSSPFTHIAVYPGDEWEQGANLLKD